ncbi:hypothetical protein OESDEN_10112 [Oesophagostomum dentatum]|uniref:Uncharacterized protein n=1 Tax=Oesophagostomum dentatum TaxID=61180 RepID=A0A0B1T2P0_OESDE|nr:hypothetical protein OESDEN_10112 [Oesophagostomum dentatum]
MHGALLGDPDNLEKRQHGDDAVNENGRVVAYILLLSVASVIICTLWAIVRIVPLLIIPALFLFRKNFALLDMLKNKWNYVYGTGSGEEEEQLREEPLDDTDIYAKLAKLEYENRRLLAELEKRKQITEELWRQVNALYTRCTWKR